MKYVNSRSLHAEEEGGGGLLPVIQKAVRKLFHAI
jgi:hypothetical protein